MTGVTGVWIGALTGVPIEGLTGVRIELAQLYIYTGRLAEARRELQGVLDEPAPTDRPRWTLKEAPRARAMLESIRDKP